MKRFKLITTSLLTVLVILTFSFNSYAVSHSVKQSLSLCYRLVIPSLLPFFILGEFLMAFLSATNISPDKLAFTGGLISGFPTGTKNVCNLYQNNHITKKEAQALLYCTANASPAYIVAFIGGNIIHSKKVGIVLLIAQSLTSCICAIAFGAFIKKKKTNWKIISISHTLCHSVTESVINCIYVCGYIVFFGIFADLLSKTEFIKSLGPELRAILLGAIEITRGLEQITPDNKLYFIAVSIILAFSGISIIMQCISCAIKSNLSPSPIVIGKICYTVIMPSISYVLYRLNFGISTALFTVFILLCTYLIYNVFDKSRSRIYNKTKKLSGEDL